MRSRLIVMAALLSLTSGGALAQSNGPPPGSAPAPSPNNAPDKYAKPPDATVGDYAVSVAPDPAATAMSDPGSAAEYGSPSVTDSPSSPMPYAAGWPPIHQDAKRPKWVQKAPPDPKPAAPPPN